jgi:hypothetical protein
VSESLPKHLVSNVWGEADCKYAVCSTSADCVQTADPEVTYNLCSILKIML